MAEWCGAHPPIRHEARIVRFMEGPRVTLKTLKLLAAVGALSASVAVAQDAPKAKMPTAKMPTAEAAAINQKLAEKVAKELASLPGTADVKVMTEGGTVTLLGTCKEDAHKAGILQAVRVVD